MRLNVVCLTLPPLRQRRQELRELADFFVRHYASHYNRPSVFLSPDTLRLVRRLRMARQRPRARCRREGIVVRDGDEKEALTALGQPQAPEPAPGRSVTDSASATSDEVADRCG